MFTVVIPAYNESATIRSTVEHVYLAFKRANAPLDEIIVSDDASTDGTAELAQSAGATVVLSSKRNIGATRNVGASFVQSEWILFVDADTIIQEDTVAEMLEAINNGAIGGGAKVAWSEPTKWWASCVLFFWNTASWLAKSPAGSYFFVRRDAFESVGGFDEKFFASEELHLGAALKKRGRLAIINRPVYTSPRKIHQFTLKEFASFFWKLIRKPYAVLGDRKDLDIWYQRRP